MARKKIVPATTEISEEPVILHDTTDKDPNLDLVAQIQLLEKRIRLLEDTLREKEKGRVESVTVIL